MSNSPLYLQIANKLKKLIKNNFYQETMTLPSELLLTKDFGVSRVTIRKAIDVLVKEGVLERKQGSGTFIKVNSEVPYELFKLKSFKEEMENLGYTYRNEILDFKVIDVPDSISSKLELQNKEKVYYIKRIKFINEKPAVVEISYMPLKLFPDLTYADLEASKYDYVEKKRKLRIVSTEVDVEAILPQEEIKVLLKLPNNLPILITNGITRVEKNIPFDYTELYFNPKNYKFKFSSTR